MTLFALTLLLLMERSLLGKKCVDDRCHRADVPVGGESGVRDRGRVDGVEELPDTFVEDTLVVGGGLLLTLRLRFGGHHPALVRFDFGQRKNSLSTMDERACLFVILSLSLVYIPLRSFLSLDVENFFLLCLENTVAGPRDSSACLLVGQAKVLSLFIIFI